MEAAALTFSALLPCNFLHFSSAPAGPQDLGMGWAGGAALCFMLLLCSHQLSLSEVCFP